MTRRLLRGKGWRAPTGPALIAETEWCARESQERLGKSAGALTFGELMALARDIEVRAESAADLLRIVASHRRSEDR